MRALFVLILAVFALAQFEHVENQGSALNLGSSSTGANGLHREFSASVTNQFVVGGDCKTTVHSVTNVQLNNGPLNSGTYFSLTINHSANSSLLVTFGTPTASFDILETIGGSITAEVIGTCAPSAAACTFHYYCDIYPSVTPLQVTIDTICNDASNPINFYDLSVTQYVETIQIVPASRSLTQSTAVIDPFAAGNLGPANFIHYYHDLNPTVAEAGASSRLYIEAINWSASSSGTAYICVSYDKMVASTSGLSQVPAFTGNIDTDPISVTTVSQPSGCSITCAAGTITGTGAVILAVPACNNGCGFKESIWIGVVPPSGSTGSTYTVRLRFRDFSVPDLVTITASPSVSDGALVIDCNGQEGNFGCDDYFEITYASVGSPAVADRRVGPFLAVELFGVYNGEAKLEISDGFLAGKTSLCPGCDVFSTCVVCDDPETHSVCTHTDCWAVVQPCQWNTDLTNDWVFTVSAVGQDDAQIPIEYGVRASIGSWPLTTVTPLAWETGQPNFGSVLVDHYQHYQITFTDAQIFDDSFFEVELFTNYDDDVVGFAWNFGSLADDGTCYGSLGSCRTNTNCNEGTLAVGSCRFEYIKCPINVDYDDYFGSSDVAQVSGAKLSQLQAGTYYFAVWGVQPGSLSYNNAIDYTIFWNYHRALPIYDHVTYNNFVYYLDYSPQYQLVVPEDDNIYSIRVRISDTYNGGVTAYARCGFLAGACPCWNADDICSTVQPSGESSRNSYDCDLSISTCDCPSGIVYISVYANQVLDQHKPVTFSLTPYFDRLLNTNVSPISASRAISPIIGTLNDNIDYLDYVRIAKHDFAAIYKINFVNVALTNEDALLITIAYTPQEQMGENVFSLPDGASPFTTFLQLTVLKDSFTCAPVDSCVVQANERFLTPSNRAGLNSHCTITLQPCFKDLNSCVQNDCSIASSVVDPSFEHDRDYFIFITNIGEPNVAPAFPEDYFEEALQFTLNVQVRDQSPYVLTNGVPFFGDVDRNNYVHFSFDASNVPANNRLGFTLYGDHDQKYPLTFFINYESKAGFADDCYGQYFPCYTCTLYTTENGDEVDHCYYEITPCELSRQKGTYYVSVFGNLQTDNDQGLFTVEANLYPTVALLDASGFGIPTPGNVRSRSSAYYSVTVPTLVSGDIVGRVLSIDVESVIKGEIYVTISKITPDDQCDCAKDGHIVLSARDDINWKRYSCELTSGEVYYISVEGDQSTYCDPTGFVLHAKIQNIIQIPITLSTNDTRVIGFYESSLAAATVENQLTLDYNQFTALKFTTNAPAGAVMDIVITEATALFDQLLPFEVRLSIDSVATPVGTNDDATGFSVGPSPDRSTCPAELAKCVFAGTADEECRIFVDACDLPQGTVTWFLTFSGELLPLNTISEIISVSIRVLASENIINVPAISTYTAVQSTGLTFADTIDRSFGKSYFTTASVGINAGESLTFAVSSSGSLFVNYQSETNSDGSCDFTCGATGSSPTCTVYACESISAGIWFVGITPSSATTTATFTVTRNQGSNSTLSLASPNPIPINSLTTSFGALDNNQWRYHSYSVPASTSGHYELTISGGADSGDIVYVASPVYLPQLALRPVTGFDVTLFNSGVTSNTCGGSAGLLPAATCCYDATTQTFAVAGSVGTYSLNVEFVEFAGNNVQSVSLPSNTTATATLGRVNWYSFTQPAGAHLWFDFEVTSGSADLYLNSGSRAGSKASNFENGGDFGYCWGNDGLVGAAVCTNTVNAGSFCDGFIPNCNPCLSANEGYTFFFAVVPNPNATFSLEIIAQTDRSLSVGQNNALVFPVPAGNLRLLDLRSSTDSFSAYSHYFFNYQDTFNGIPKFIPALNDPAVIDKLDYANLEIYIDNFRDSAGVLTTGIPVRVYINYGDYAGSTSSSLCYGGREITTGGTILPCIENSGGAAFSNSSAIQCSINVCDLGPCGGVLFLSTGRLTSGSVESFSYDIEVTKDYDAVTDWVDIVSVTPGSFPLSYRGDNTTDVVYFRFVGTGVNNFADSTSQYLKISLSNVTGALNTEVDLTYFSGQTCTPFSAGVPFCNNIGTDDLCELLTDPCGTGDLFDKNEVAFFRVSRESSDTGDWSFIFNIQVLTVTPIDSTLTQLEPFVDETSQTTYSHVKEITDFTWHFYEFDVSPNDGYSWLSVSIDELCCVTSVAAEIYYSWEEKTDHEVYDNARPNRWAATSCNVRADTTSSGSSSNDIQDICNFWGGAYRIGIFAPVGYQLFPNPILGVIYPVLYSIEVTVNTLAREQIALECAYTQTQGASTFFSRLELYVPAENRGAQLFIDLDLNVASSGSDITLWASKNARPWNRFSTGSICSWDVTNDGDYNCSPASGSSSCRISIPPCEFEDGIWYLFLQRTGVAAGTLITVSSHIDRKYIPTIDVRTTPVVTVSGSVTSNYYQYYRVLVDPTVDLSYLTVQVISTGCNTCSYDLYLSSGPRGLAADDSGSNALEGPSCVDNGNSCSPDCYCYDRFTSSSIIELDTCEHPEVTSYFVGVVTDNVNNCEYNLKVWGTPRRNDVLPFNVETCSIASCLEYWQIVDSTGNSDLTGAIVTVIVSNNDSTDLEVYVNYNNVGEDCATSRTCPAGTECLYTFSCLTGTLYLGLSSGTSSCLTCDGIEYSIITTSVVRTTFNTLSLGTRGVAGPATFVTGSQFVYASTPISSYSVGTYSTAGCTTGCLQVLAPNSAYFFSSGAGIQLEAVSTINTLSSSAQSYTLSEPFFHFSVSVPAGVDSFTLNFNNVAYCACDGDIAGLGLYLRASTVAPPFNGCGDCTGLGGGAIQLTAGSCPSNIAPVTFTCVAEEIYYFTISSCELHVCDVTFTAFVEFSSARTQISGNHNTAFSTISYSDVACVGGTTTRYYVDVTDILSVSIKEVHGASAASVSIVYAGSACSSAFGCSILNNAEGVSSSCRAADCNIYSFAASGTYFIDVSTGALPAGVSSSAFYLQVVNSWVDFSGSVSNTIIGQTRHFYKLSNAAQAVSIDLTVIDGPAVQLIVFDNNYASVASDLKAGFQESTVCAFGTCTIYIPTFAKHSLADTFYIEIDSSNIVGGLNDPLGFDSQYTRHTNVHTEKTTFYTLSATLGTANCASPPSTGFCASSVEGGNVWSEINNSVWAFEHPELKDNEAECRFNELTEQCPYPSEECRKWLKVFSCLESFPQCDGSGFQLGMCQDVCYEVQDACGAWVVGVPHYEYNCCSSRYVAGNDSTISTCYNIPPPPPPPATFEPELGSDVSSVPPAFVVPVFTTIDVFLPDDFVRDNAKAAVATNISSGSSLVFTWMLVSIILFALIL